MVGLVDVSRTEMCFNGSVDRVPPLNKAEKSRVWQVFA